MTSPVVTIDGGATLRSAAEALRKARIGTLAVVKEGDVAGILSERDVVNALAGGANPDHAVVSDAMSESPRYLAAGEDVHEAVGVMLSAGIRHLPVFEDGDLVGIVSIRDLISTLRR